MSRYRLSAEDKLRRLAVREDQRAAAQERVDARRAWHESRVHAAEKRTALARLKRAKARRKAAKKDTSPTVTVLPHTVSKHGNAIDSTLGVAVFGINPVSGNYRQRRAMGARGHVRKPRRRELPRAAQRRAQRLAETW